jgi:hypothetical protein
MLPIGGLLNVVRLMDKVFPSFGIEPERLLKIETLLETMDIVGAALQLDSGLHNLVVRDLGIKCSEAPNEEYSK